MMEASLAIRQVELFPAIFSGGCLENQFLAELAFIAYGDGDFPPLGSTLFYFPISPLLLLSTLLFLYLYYQFF